MKHENDESTEGHEPVRSHDLILDEKELMKALRSDYVQVPRETLERFMSNALRRERDLENALKLLLQLDEERPIDTLYWRRSWDDARHAAMVLLGEIPVVQVVETTSRTEAQE